MKKIQTLKLKIQNMNIEIKQFGKWLVRKVAWFLLISLLVNLVGSFVAPKVARAADPNMLLFWAGSGGSCAGGGAPPAGWTLVNDGSFTADFPRGEAAYAASAGGAATHNHVVGGSQTATTGTARNGTTTGSYSANVHTHPISGSTDSISSLPAYKDLCVISYSGIPTQIPQNAIAIFDTNSVPANWQDYSATFGTNYIRGNTTPGGTGGSNTHQSTGHTISGITLSAAPQNVTTTTGTANRASQLTHTHTVANQTSDTPNTEPPYITVELYQATANTSIPPHLIAMFDGSSFSSFGWEIVSNAGGDFYQKFPKVTGTYGSTSGATTHHHADKTALISTSNTAVNGANGAGGIQGHTHTVTVTEADGTDTNIPPYSDVVFAKRSYVFTSLTTDKANYPTLGETITADAAVDNHSASNLANTKIDYVIFEDADADNFPDNGETYITTNCAGSGALSTNELTQYTEYTWRITGLNVNSEAQGTDQESCANSNFPDNTDYVLWAKWYDNGATLIYDTNYAGFHSIPTLTEILFMALVGCAVFLGVRTGAIKMKMKNSKGYDNPPSDLPPYPNHHGEPFDARGSVQKSTSSRSNDGITNMRDKINE